MDNKCKLRHKNPMPFRVAGGGEKQRSFPIAVCQEISRCPETELWKCFPRVFMNLKLTVQPKPLRY